MRLGAVIFDNKGNYDTKNKVLELSNGWASVAGHEAFRLNTVADLTNDTQWITNLDFKRFTEFSVRNQGNLRSDSYLRMTTDQLLNELGLVELNNQDNSGVATAAARSLALIADRVLRLSQQRYNVDPRGAKLLDDYVRCFRLPTPQVPEQMQSAVESIAKHALMICINDFNVKSSNNEVMALSRNRLVHARQILNTPVPPDVGWSRITVKSLDNIKWPFIAKVRMDNFDPTVTDILAPTGGSQTVREFITDVEYAVYKKYCTITPTVAFVCDGGELKISDLAKHLPNSPLAECSISNGIIAENLWLTPCQTHMVRGEKRYSVAAAYYRSIDRMIMLELAIQLAARGVRIKSYGLGAVNTIVPEGQIGRVINIASEYKLLPPRSSVIKNHIQRRLNPSVTEIKQLSNASREEVIDHYLRVQANYAAALNCDAVVITENISGDELRTAFVQAMNNKPIDSKFLENTHAP